MNHLNAVTYKEKRHANVRLSNQTGQKLSYAAIVFHYSSNVPEALNWAEVPSKKWTGNNPKKIRYNYGAGSTGQGWWYVCWMDENGVFWETQPANLRSLIDPTEKFLKKAGEFIAEGAAFIEGGLTGRAPLQVHAVLLGAAAVGITVAMLCDDRGSTVGYKAYSLNQTTDTLKTDYAGNYAYVEIKEIKEIKESGKDRREVAIGTRNKNGKQVDSPTTTYAYRIPSKSKGSTLFGDFSNQANEFLEQQRVKSYRVYNNTGWDLSGVNVSHSEGTGSRLISFQGDLSNKGNNPQRPDLGEWGDGVFEWGSSTLKTASMRLDVSFEKSNKKYQLSLLDVPLDPKDFNEAWNIDGHGIYFTGNSVYLNTPGKERSWPVKEVISQPRR